MELSSPLNIKLPFPFVNISDSVEVENVTITPATRKYWDKLYEPITILFQFST